MILLKKYGPLIAALATIAVLYTTYDIWKHETGTKLLLNDLSLKQKCSTDGTSYFNDTLLPKDTPQAIAKDNQEITQQFGQQAAEQAGLTESISFGNPEYAYSKKMNTCIISYMETTVLTTGTVTNYSVKDIYSNKELISYFEINGKPGIAGSNYDDFTARRDAIMWR